MRSERGAGSVFVLTIVTVVVFAVAAVAVLASGYQARRQAAAAADLAALAAVRQLGVDASRACIAAEQIAVANRAELRDCIVDGDQVEVQVRVDVIADIDWLPDQERRARAGPAGPAG